jgi:hypothetical protein
MGATKDMWMDEVERIQEDYASQRLTRAEAGRMLIRMGFDSEEADDLLNQMEE